MKAVQVSRRDFLKVSGMAGAGLALASCTAVVPETGMEAAPQEVTVFFWDGPPLIGIREEALAPFDEAYPGCELNFTSVPGGWNAGYSEKLYAGLAANDPPDLFIIRIADLPEFLSKDLLLDLKPYVDRDSYDLNEFPALAIESYTHDGGIYGMPDNVASVAMFCNQDMIEEAGAQVPTNQWDDPGWTVDDFFNMCEAVTQRDANGDTTQYAYQVTGWSVIWQIWVRIFGGQLVDDPFYPTECTLNEPGAVEGLQFYADLIHKYGFAPRFDVMQDLGAVELMHTGRLAIINNGSWSFPNFHDVDYEVTLGHYPSGPGGRANYVYYFPLVIPKTTQVPDCAWNLLKYFNGPAMEKIIQDGGLQGTTLSAQQAYFLTDTRPPQNKQVMVDAVRNFVAPDPVLTNYNEVSRTMQAEVDLLLNGEERDAKVVADRIKAAVDPLIQEGQWR